MHDARGPAEDKALADEVEEWLRANLPREWAEAIDHDDAAALRAARERLDVAGWWDRLGDAGWFFSAWPQEYGGHGFETHRAGVVNNVLRRYKVPRTDNPLGINVSQALLRWGTDAQRARYLPPIARQREIWVQLFSEPGAGSDLAGLSTRAVRDGDVWAVNGQKVWSSWAHKAQMGLLLARTDPDVPKHQGLTLFLLDMSTPGITVRPLRQMTGEAFFNEVFFDDVACPDGQRLGGLGEGWRLASSLLTFERGAGVGGGASAPSMHVGRTVEALLRHYPHVADPVLRQRLATAYTRDKIEHWTRMRIEAGRRAGRPPGNEYSVLKLFHSETVQALQTLSLDLEGLNGTAHAPDDRWASTTQYGFLRARSQTIAGGTSEIQRNILGEKVLGLPKEPAVDRDVPWSQVLRS
jgi:alkylation response protein AidB-like acyl-CoA dehydrogenase